MKILRWIRGHIQRDKIWNEDIGTSGSILYGGQGEREETEIVWTWKRRCIDALVRNG